MSPPLPAPCGSPLVSITQLQACQPLCVQPPPPPPAPPPPRCHQAYTAPAFALLPPLLSACRLANGLSRLPTFFPLPWVELHPWHNPCLLLAHWLQVGAGLWVGQTSVLCLNMQGRPSKFALAIGPKVLSRATTVIVGSGSTGGGQPASLAWFGPHRRAAHPGHVRLR